MINFFFLFSESYLTGKPTLKRYPQSSIKCKLSDYYLQFDSDMVKCKMTVDDPALPERQLFRLKSYEWKGNLIK
jgi:hypothetical protein